MIWLFSAAVFSGAMHAVRDTLFQHWDRSVFKRFGADSFWGPANEIWFRRYKNGDPANRRRWPAIFDGVMDAWHLATSLEFAAWVVVGGVLAGLAWWVMALAWVAGQGVFALFYDHVLLTSDEL